MYGVRGEFTEDVSETAADPIFTVHENKTSEDGTHSGSRNVVG